jgi:hypothetical protein
MSDVTVKQRVLDELAELFDVTDKALSEWTGEGNLQFPALLLRMAARMNWTDKQMREADPFVRKYVRSHPDWYVTRGAHGGIMRASEKQKKEADKAAKDLAKKKLQDEIDAKVAAAQAAAAQANTASE